MILPPLSLYLHLPWCVRKCPYCDFNSHTAGDKPPKARYLDALLVDLDGEAQRANGRQLESVFLGGGTPSLFSPEEIGRLLDGVRARFQLRDELEVTMEANPGTVEFGSPRAYRDAGVNRLSIGAQSFDDELLRVLGRIHSSADIRRAVDEAHDGGFDNINIDVMHGLPGQNIDRAMADLTAAAELQPAHISWYQLTLEPNTVFYARPPANLPDDELAWGIQESGQSLLENRGYEQYEVSAYARDGHKCAHNLNYWLFGDYLAAGAGAHGKISDAEGIYRYQKPANPLQYMNKVAESADPTRLRKQDIVFEFMLNALRLPQGFAELDFASRTGLSPAELASAAAAALSRGLIERDDDGIWCPTSLGRRFLNDLQTEFLLDS
ncbi:MAG: radical SAM family heme chaperone HemW [Gammaproteobacteria bacterium]|nr:radical SAM family heme chaperone HemW [Gammaproteobacteria bacterium]